MSTPAVSIFAKALAICFTHQVFGIASSPSRPTSYQKGYTQCSVLVPEIQVALHKQYMEADQRVLRRAAAKLGDANATRIDWKRFAKRCAQDAKEAAQK